MTEFRCRILAAATLAFAVLMLLQPAARSVAAPQPPPLIGYELEDQFKATHRRDDVDGRVIVSIASGRKGREFTAPWGDAVRERLAAQLLEEELAVVPVADLRGVPGFLKKKIRGKFPEEAARWVLMDWRGEFSKAYDLPEEGVSLLLFDRSGGLVTKMAASEVNEAQLAHLLALVDELLGS